VIIEHPEDVVVKTGRSCILAIMGDDARALVNLTEHNLATRSDWIGYHIRGMIMLRAGKLDEAISIFKKGVEDDPWVLDRDYFRTALSIAHLRRFEYIEASKTLENVMSADLQIPANILRLHSFGALKRTDRASDAYRVVSEDRRPIIFELTKELHRRYIINQSGQHDDEWLVRNEINVLLMAA
jgi:tetratricopeptide (TPR) repeat protein